MKSTSRKKWYVLVALDRFPSLSMHSVALELLYNIMRREPNFTIERFQRYAASKISKISVQPRGVFTSVRDKTTIKAEELSVSLPVSRMAASS